MIPASSSSLLFAALPACSSLYTLGLVRIIIIPIFDRIGLDQCFRKLFFVIFLYSDNAMDAAATVCYDL